MTSNLPSPVRAPQASVRYNSQWLGLGGRWMPPCSMSSDDLIAFTERLIHEVRQGLPTDARVRVRLTARTPPCEVTSSEVATAHDMADRTLAEHVVTAAISSPDLHAPVYSFGLHVATYMPPPHQLVLLEFMNARTTIRVEGERMPWVRDTHRAVTALLRDRRKRLWRLRNIWSTMVFMAIALALLVAALSQIAAATLTREGVGFALLFAAIILVGVWDTAVLATPQPLVIQPRPTRRWKPALAAGSLIAVLIAILGIVWIKGADPARADIITAISIIVVAVAAAIPFFNTRTHA